MTDNNKLRKLTAEMFAILSISDPSMRLEERQLLWTLFVEAAKCCRSALEAWVRKKIFLGQSIPMRDTEVEHLCNNIEEIGLKHLLNQLQGEEQPSYCLGPSDTSLRNYFIRIADKHNLPKNKRDKYVVAQDQSKRSESGRSYLILATGVDTSDCRGNDDGSTFSEYKWGVDAVWLEDVEELRAHDRFQFLDDASKTIILLDKMGDRQLRDFDEAAARYSIDNRFLQPYRRRLSRIKGNCIMGVQRIAYVMDISEPTVRKRLKAAYQKLDSPASLTKISSTAPAPSPFPVPPPPYLLRQVVSRSSEAVLKKTT